MIRRFLAVIASLTLLVSVPLAALQAPEGFKPLSELPPTQQLPAGPFLVGAYSFVWLALMGYLWSIWRRLTRVERDMKALEERSRRSAGR